VPDSMSHDRLSRSGQSAAKQPHAASSRVHGAVPAGTSVTCVASLCDPTGEAGGQP